MTEKEYKLTNETVQNKNMVINKLHDGHILQDFLIWQRVYFISRTNTVLKNSWNRRKQTRDLDTTGH